MDSSGVVEVAEELVVGGGFGGEGGVGEEFLGLFDWIVLVCVCVCIFLSVCV